MLNLRWACHGIVPYDTKLLAKTNFHWKLYLCLRIVVILNISHGCNKPLWTVSNFITVFLLFCNLSCDSLLLHMANFHWRQIVSILRLLWATRSVVQVGFEKGRGACLGFSFVLFIEEGRETPNRSLSFFLFK